MIEYNSLPVRPVAADAWSDPGGGCVSGAARPVISTATPKLWAKLRDVDNSVRGRFEWWNAAGVKVGEYAHRRWARPATPSTRRSPRRLTPTAR